MEDQKQIVLITGGNSGVGFELAAQLLKDTSKHVLLGCRSTEKGRRAVQDLSVSALGKVELLQIDLADDSSIEAAAETVARTHGRLDALVNNAAIGSLSPEIPLSVRMMDTYRTNTVGVVVATEAFLPLLRKSSSTPRVINVSSGAGLTRKVGDPRNPNFGVNGLPYSGSKAALNLVTASQARYYGGEGVKVFAYTPGFVASNLGPHNTIEQGAQPTEVGAAPMVAILNGDRDEEHGCFLRGGGNEPW